MKRILFTFMFVGALAACDKPEAIQNKNVYECGNYTVEMNFSEDGNVLTAVIAGDSVDLNLTESASGAKYTGVLNDTNVVLWGKGDLWTMFVGDDEVAIECGIK